jgi:hypothetical protein
VLGIDGIVIPEHELLFPAGQFRRYDLEWPFDLGRRFDLALCLEVAEHLSPEGGRTLIRSLTQHSDVVVFSAAIPGQPGQNHIHCRWPEHWQGLFNDEGYRCDDWLRWALWHDDTIEPWYRQNIFMAYRDAAATCRERRIAPVVHPEMIAHLQAHALESAREEGLRAVENGYLRLSDYGRIAFMAPLRKVLRRLRRGRARHP